MTAGKKKPEHQGPDTPDSERTLRDDAEQQLARSPKRSADLAGQTPGQLIHELQVHQVELETQAEELIRAHLELGESRDKYLDLYEFAPVGYFTLNDKALIEEVNLAGATLLGIERRDLISAQFGKFIAEKDSDEWYRYFMNVKKQDHKQTCTLTLKRGDGSMFPARLEGIRLTGSDGITTARIAISDISDIWQIEALKESEERFHSMFERHDSVMLLIAPDSGKIIEANLAAARFYGRSQKELCSLSIDKINIMSPEEIAAARMKAARDQENFFIFSHLLASGEIRLVEVHSSPIDIGGTTVLFSIVNDITDRRRAEEALQATREWLGIALRAACAGTWDWDILTGKLAWSPELFDLFGLSPGADPSFETWRAALHPDDREKAMASINQSILEHSYLWNEYRIILPDGQVRWIGAGGSTSYATGGEPVRMSGVCIDITDRKLAEKALQLLLSRLESAMGAGHIAWWEMDCTTGNVTFSERKARMLGYPAKQFSHYTDFTTLLHPDDSEPAMQEMRDHLSGLKKQYAVEYRIRTRDGGYLWFHDTGRISEYAPDGRPHKVTGLVIDITERKRAETAQLKTNQKLNVLSDLTRKDLTNQIFVLDGYLNLAKKHADDQAHVIKTLSKGDKALQSIHEIIEYTSDYQDMGIKTATWQNVNLALLFGLSHVSIGEIQHSLETENLEIFADPLLEKVCQRLFENSLSHGGHVTRIRVWHTTTTDGITILFEDDGVGIPPEKKEQIFLRGDDTTSFSMRSLIFVREILDITGITITENGEPGKGARFEMAVPNGAWRSTGKGD